MSCGGISSAPLFSLERVSWTLPMTDISGLSHTGKLAELQENVMFCRPGCQFWLASTRSFRHPQPPSRGAQQASIKWGQNVLFNGIPSDADLYL